MTSPILLIPLLPLAAFLVIGLFGRWLKERGPWIGTAAVTASFALSVRALFDVLSTGPVELPLYTILQSGRLNVELGLAIDALAAVMLVLVTGISSLVHLYSARYMQGDPRYTRFFALIALFTATMLLVVMSPNLLQLYLSWEQMGICSYLLISHWANRPAAVRAATKAFLVNAVADVGLALGVMLAFITFGTLDISRILAAAPGKSAEMVNLVSWLGLDWPVSVTTLIALLLFVGASGKSAQIPLHVWLPFAMEAPTPVSALIHAATMVNAGVFLLLRFGPLLLLSPFAMAVIAVVGATTALVAATIALTQSDIKRILAYSTMSQLGFMMLATGVGAFVAALFHLVAHGAFKAFLFLSTGDAVQSLVDEHRYEDPEDRHQEPVRVPWHLAGIAGVLAIVPPLVLFSGPYPKLWMSPHEGPATVIFCVLVLAGTFLTAFHVFRLIVRLASHRLPSPHYSPFFRIPLVIVIVAAGVIVLLGWLWQGFSQALTPLLIPSAPESDSPPGLIGLLALLAALGGWGMAYASPLWPSPRSPWLMNRAKTLYVLALSRGYADELYEVLIVRPTLGFARWLWHTVDVRIVDRAVTAPAAVMAAVARWLWHAVDVRVIDRSLDETVKATFRMGQWLWKTVDVRGIDRAVDGTGTATAKLGRWLWQSVDVRSIDRMVDGVAYATETYGHAQSRLEPRALRHHLLILIVCLLLGLGLLFALY